MKLTDIDDRYSLIQYIDEGCINTYKMKAHVERIDEQFFKPWARYLEEAQLSPQQINQVFQAAHKEAQASGQNSTMLGKMVEKIIPDSMLQKLSDSLPEPDPNAANDPKFEQKATAAVNKLDVPADTKTGLMKIVSNAVKNPAVQPVVLALVGSVLGGIISKAGPFISATFPGGGTTAVAITGALVAGGVSVAAAKIQGKSWKDAFKGAIKPALAGAAGAVVGKLAAEFIGSMGKGDDKAAAGGLGSDAEAGLASDQAMQDRLLNKYPPDKGYTFGAQGDSIEVYDASGKKVFTGDIPLKTMDAQTFADLTSQGKMATPGVSSGAVASDPTAGTGIAKQGGASASSAAGSGSSALDDFAGGPEKYDQMQTALSTQEKASIAQDVAKQMGADPGANVKFQGNVPVSVDGQPVPQNIQQNYGGAAAGGPNYSPPEQTGQVTNSQTTEIPGVASSAASSSADPFTVNGQTMKASLRDTIMNMSDADGEKAYSAWKVLVGGEADTQAKMGAGQVLDKLTKKYQESVTRSGKKLTEGQCYLIMKRVAVTNRDMLIEGHLVVEAGFMQKAGTWLKTKAQNVTQQVTADKLMQSWKKAGSPTDSNAVADIMTKAGVNAEVVSKVFKDMQLPAPGQEAPAAGADNVVGKPGEPGANDAAPDSKGAAGAASAAGGAAGAALPYPKVVDLVTKLTLKDKMRLMTWIEKNKSTGTAG